MWQTYIIESILSSNFIIKNDKARFIMKYANSFLKDLKNLFNYELIKIRQMRK